ncbi:hypothetical protein [Streptomyces sp. NPDC059649]|uniref:hypothetical protein n=1 Tax=Streptomyces sp. NPDC059649 TaxID=3346895 RepID=UPI0036BD7F33
MSHLITTRRRQWSLLGRAVVALSAASVLTPTGLPTIGHDEADAAPRKGRCDDVWLNRRVVHPPADTLPGNLPYNQRPKSAWDSYDFDTPLRALDGLRAPTEAELAKLTEPYQQYPEGSRDRAWATYKQSPVKAKGWDYWLEFYISNQYVNRRGDAFEGKVVKDYQLGGKFWLCQEPISGVTEEGRPFTRKYDAINHREKIIYEFKSNGERIPRQLEEDEAVLKDPKYKGYRIRYIFGDKPDQDSIDDIKALDKKLGGQGRLGYFDHRSQAISQYKSGPYTKPDWIMNPDPTKRPQGSLPDAIRNSAETPETARIRQGAARRIDTRGGLPRGGPGGIDFSTLELRYVSTPTKGKGLDYSFKADYMPHPDKTPGWGGQAKAQLASDAFFTWLALTPEKFWVNLNPDQPDRIMDTKFGKTDAGRVLLEADLQMKHDFYKAMDPKTGLGKRFWAALPKQRGYPCLPGLRNWIEPKPAKVREQDGGIYILDAPLRLKSTAQTTITPGPGTPICTPNEAETKAAQRVVDAMIVPAVEKTINSAPQYADLRRVYTSRVAAEWVKKQDTAKPGDFHKIIGSNNVSKWPLRGANKNWTREGVFKKYRKIFTKGEFQYEIPAGGRTQIYIVGGVDFSKSPKRNVTRLQFNIEHPRLDKTTKQSQRAQVTYNDTDTVYLGASGSARDTGGDGDSSTPSPTPTPTKPHDPTTPPPSHTPAPGNSSQPPIDQKLPPTPPAKGPHGGLADTGSHTPVGLITATAAALAAAGAGLTWWMRRRRTAQE